MEKILILFGKILFFIKSKQNRLVNKYLQEKYEKSMKHVGKCVKFNGISYISGVENIEIGNNVHIGNNAHISGVGELYIGDNTHISRNLLILTDNHNYKGEYLPYDNNIIAKRVIIEKNVWIGMNVVILPGSHIEEGSIIGAGSIVSGRIERLSIYGATLGHVIKKRDIEHYERLDKSLLFSGENGNKLSENCIHNS